MSNPCFRLPQLDGSGFDLYPLRTDFVIEFNDGGQSTDFYYKTASNRHLVKSNFGMEMGFISAENWRMKCIGDISGSDSIDGMELYKPDGTVYKMKFDWLSGRWDEIVTQGGQFEKSPSSEHYLLSGIWVLLGSNWFEISAVEMNGEFRVACFKCNNAPVPESKKLFKPERKKVVQFPKDCSLDRFLSQGPGMVEAEILSKDAAGFVFNDCLTLSHGTNHRIVIVASEEFLGSIELHQ